MTLLLASQDCCNHLLPQGHCNKVKSNVILSEAYVAASVIEVDAKIKAKQSAQTWKVLPLMCHALGFFLVTQPTTKADY